jgi:hypothetical protein
MMDTRHYFIINDRHNTAISPYDRFLTHFHRCKGGTTSLLFMFRSVGRRETFKKIKMYFDKI